MKRIRAWWCPLQGKPKLARSDLFGVGNHRAHPQSRNSGFICEAN